MKKDFNLLKMSIVGIVCASIGMPAFAASSVRSLGGVGTLSGTSSVRAGAASETSGSTVTSARAGTVRVNSGSRVNSGASLRTPSTRAATAPRLSIGKYLSGSSALSGGSSVRPGQSGTSGGGEVNYDNLASGEFIEVETSGTGAIVNAIVASLADGTSGLLTNENVKDFAIPQPSASCEDNVCVLSTDGEEYYWLELVDVDSDN